MSHVRLPQQQIGGSNVEEKSFWEEIVPSSYWTQWTSLVLPQSVLNF